MYFYENLKKYRHLLNAGEKKMLESLLDFRKDIQSATIRQVASEHFTTPNSIIRMCQKLGFKGFTEFKEAYYFSLQEQKNIKNITSLDEQIIKTKQLITHELLTQTIEMLNHAESIAIFAVGLSRFVAEDLNERLKLLGKFSQTFVDPHIMKHTAKTMRPNQVAIAISLSGETDTVLSAATIAKAQGVKLISITGFSNNTLAKLSDVQLYAMTSELYLDGIDASDRFSLYYIANLLFNQYVNVFC